MLKHACGFALWMAATLTPAADAVPMAAGTSVAEANAPARPGWSAASRSSGQPTARHESAAAVVDGELFVIGGRGQPPLDILDLATGEWRQGAAAPMEIHHTQAAVLDGRIYVIGALTGPWPQEEVVPRVLIYDPESDRWQEGPELPADRRRGGGGLVVHEGVFYLVGGNRLGHRAGFVPWLDAFDPKTGTWTALPDAPHARDHFHAAVLDGKIYAVGGRLSGHEDGGQMGLHLDGMDVYDVAARRWTTAAQAIPTPRSGVSVVVLDGRIVVLGGESERQERAHAEVEAYDPRNQTWTSLPAMPVGRHGMQAVVAGDAIHVVAGSGNRGGGPELNDHWVLGAL
ncbi:Kelch repeat-containing protein [[Pseudomonas] boreopolis]|uniref:Kelch repeat-containing protein n=1 Tax=Xanthomonas boreopolis TaxID=86183 RepID=UPI003D4DBB66